MYKSYKSGAMPWNRSMGNSGMREHGAARLWMDAMALLCAVGGWRAAAEGDTTSSYRRIASEFTQFRTQIQYQ